MLALHILLLASTAELVNGLVPCSYENGLGQIRSTARTSLFGSKSAVQKKKGLFGITTRREGKEGPLTIVGATKARDSRSALGYSNDGDSDMLSPRPNTKLPSVTPNGGRITLVGAGPGSVDLLTVAAHRLLTGHEATDTKPKLIIADRLVSPEILELCQHCELRVARKHPGCAEKAQEEIYRWAQEGLKEGRHVIRLKIGDPFVFGRGGEEVLKFRSMGVEATVIPGVSAAFSAPLLGGIPVTHRGSSNQVVMCTGYGRNGTSPDLIQYHKEQTVVFLMAVGRLRQLCHNLVTMAGYPTSVPVGVVERAGCPNQRTLVGTMDTIADLAEKYEIQAPSTIVVGDVVKVLMTVEDVEDEAAETLHGLVEPCGTNVTTMA